MKTLNLKTIGLALFFINEAVHAAPTAEQVEAYIKSVGGVENTLKEMERKTAKVLPKIIDSETELFSVISFPKEIRYSNSLYNYEKSDIPDIDALRNTLFSTNSKYLCSSPVSKILLKRKNVKYIYSFYSKSREFLFDYTVDKNKCNSINH